VIKKMVGREGFAVSQSHIVFDSAPRRLSRTLTFLVRVAFFRFLRKLKTLLLASFESLRVEVLLRTQKM
ncbi:hypothetical protein, partial [Leptospira interrogans]